MITVRSIIVEALNRSNLVSRRQSPPADMTETAFRLLKGVASKYSNDNLLQFLISECGATLDKQEFVIGDTDADHPDEYMTVDLFAPNIQKVNRMYWRAKEPNGLGSYIELSYASPDDFDGYPDGSGVFTYQPVNDLQMVLKTKLRPDTNTEFKITYNRKWSIGLDDELRIPEQYSELFIVALTHKLALTFPRLSTEQVNLLKNELIEMEKNVATATRAHKYVSRSTQLRAAVSRADFISGRMFFGGV